MSCRRGGDLLPMRNQWRYCIWLSSSKNVLHGWKATLVSEVREVLLTRLSQSKRPVSQQELDSCHSLESPCRPSCLARPFAASSNTLMHSIYSWERRGDNGSAQCVWAWEGWRVVTNWTDTRGGKCGRTAGDGRVMDERGAPLLSRVWRGRV